MSAMDFADATEFESSEWGESESESELFEARRNRTPARPGSYAKPPPQRGVVTRREFQEALDKVRADVAQNARAISSVGKQVDALSKRAQTEVKTLRTDVTRTRDDTRNTLQMLAILPMLATGGTVDVPDQKGNAVKVSTPPDSLMQMLPLLLLSGFGGPAGSGGAAGGSADSGLMLAVALIAASGHGGKS